MTPSPTGTVTFLFTDVEGSTRLWETDPAAARVGIARHDALVGEAVAAAGGHVFKSSGDGACCAFATAPAAVEAALEAQRRLTAAQAAGELPFAVRVALHTGDAEWTGDDYLGRPLNRVARLLAAGHGGQVLLSPATQELTRDALPEGAALRDLGERRLKDLQTPLRVWQLLHPDLPAEFPPLRSLDARPQNLPIQTTPLVGREDAVRAVRDLLRRPGCRLVTLTGPGGTGKTRLALQAAADVLDEYRDGVWLADLSAVTDPARVPDAVRRVLGVPDDGDAAAAVAHYLRERELLLVLDNFEQILAAGPAVAGWLESAPGLRVLVTSRSALRLRGEQEYPVSPLGLPPRAAAPQSLTQYAAVELFIQRARAARRDFEVNAGNAPALAEICVRLDGLPLAIELAAARVRLFAPEALLRRLERRLDFLTGGARDLPARQQTLRAAIAWSCDLLTPEDRTLFRRLAVFAGGFSLDAAERVCTGAGLPDAEAFDLLGGVTSLVEQSLVHGHPDSERFGMLVTLREYALELLAASGEEAVLRDAHAAWIAELLEAAAPHLDSGPGEAWLARLGEDWDNVCAALDYLAATDPRRALALAGGIWLAGYRNGRPTEMRDRLGALLALPENREPTATRALAAHGAATLEGPTGRPERAWELFREALAIRRTLGDPLPLAATLNNMGVLAREQGDYAAARTYHEEALALRRTADQPLQVAASLANLGLVTSDLGEFAAARAPLSEALEIYRRLGNQRNAATVLNNLGRLEMFEGRREAARGHFSAALELHRSVDDARGETLARLALASCAALQGDADSAEAGARESLLEALDLGDAWLEAYARAAVGYAAETRADWPEALAAYRDSLRHRMPLGDQAGAGEILERIAVALHHLGDDERALRLLGAEDALQRRLGYWRFPGLESGDSVRAASAARDPAGTLRLVQEGAALGLETAVALALGSD